MDTMTQEEKLQYIINSNPSLFDLTFKDYNAGAILFSEPTERALNKAKADLAIFEERQEAIYKREKIAQGDWVIERDGTTSRVTVDQWGDSVQVGGIFSGSFHLNSNGCCSYSGGCGDTVQADTLEFTGEYKEGKCWIFSGGYAGANKGVYLILKFKVWRQKV